MHRIRWHAFLALIRSSDSLTAQVILRHTRNGQRSSGYGFVSLSSAEAANQAVELLNKKELDGRDVIIEIAKPADQKDKDRKQKRFRRKPGRRGSKAVPGEVTEAEANGEVENPTEADAPATDEAAKPKKKKKSHVSATSSSHRSYLIVYSRYQRKPKRKPAADDGSAPEDAEAAPPAAADAPANDTPKKPRTRKPRPPRTPRAAGEDPTGELSKTVLFVANLGFTIDDAGLAALFTDAGINVVSARIVRRRWGKPRRSKGYGFVDVGNAEEQTKAIDALEGKDVGGRPIAVKVAVDPQHEEQAHDAQEVDPEAPSAPAPAE